VKYLIWDFDGTLGYREGRSWAVVLLETLDWQMPGHPYTADQLAPYLRSGFPWHMPEQPHTHIATADQWWAEMTPVFVAAFGALGLDTAPAARLAEHVRPIYSDPARFRLFDDTLPALDALSARGWTHVILSNHVPEFDGIAAALGLTSRMAAVFNSAWLGYEKPHPQIFRQVLDILDGGGPKWMIGDNFTADVRGAEAMGLPAILVRKPNVDARYFAPDLTQVGAIVENTLA
jgi:putative hydrolase of the HAD superfamily